MHIILNNQQESVKNDFENIIVRTILKRSTLVSFYTARSNGLNRIGRNFILRNWILFYPSKSRFNWKFLDFFLRLFISKMLVLFFWDDSNLEIIFLNVHLSHSHQRIFQYCYYDLKQWEILTILYLIQFATTLSRRHWTSEQLDKLIHIQRIRWRYETKTIRTKS